MSHAIEGGSGPLAFVLDRSLHLRVSVKINGILANAIIDSGAGRAVLDRDFAQRHGVVRRRGFNVAGLTGNTTGEIADDLQIDLKKLSLRGLSAGVLDLNRYPLEGGPRIDLVIGRELFSRMIVEIDFQAGLIEFLDHKTNHSFTGVPVPLEEGPRGTPYIRVTVEGHPIQVAFDLGYNAALLLSPQFAAEVGLLVGKPSSTVASIGVEGLVISQVATLSAIQVGGVAIHNVPIEVPPSWNRAKPGVIGLEILKRFRITTDYPHNRIWLEPNAALLNAPIDKDRSGIGAAPIAGGLSVIHIAEGSPAEHIGLMRGDMIVKIDGHDVDTNYIMTHPRMGARPAGTTSRLTLADGRQLDLTLADYY